MGIKLLFTRGTLCHCPELKQQYHNQLVTRLKPQQDEGFLTPWLQDLEVENSKTSQSMGKKLPGSPGCLPHQAGERRHGHPPVKVCAENKVFFTFVHVHT